MSNISKSDNERWIDEMVFCYSMLSSEFNFWFVTLFFISTSINFQTPSIHPFTFLSRCHLNPIPALYPLCKFTVGLIHIECFKWRLNNEQDAIHLSFGNRLQCFWDKKYDFVMEKRQNQESPFEWISKMKVGRVFWKRKWGK